MLPLIIFRNVFIHTVSVAEERAGNDKNIKIGLSSGRQPAEEKAVRKNHCKNRNRNRCKSVERDCENQARSKLLLFSVIYRIDHQSGRYRPKDKLNHTAFAFEPFKLKRKVSLEPLCCGHLLPIPDFRFRMAVVFERCFGFHLYTACLSK